MPYVEYVEVSTHKSSGHTYILVNFWDTRIDRDSGKLPVLTNDFLMQLAPTGERIVRDASGALKRSDGVFVPVDDVTAQDEAIGWEREMFSVDVKAQVTANVARYWVTAQTKKWSGDHTADASKPFVVDGVVQPQHESLPLERDKSDPRGVLSILEVAALEGRKEEVPVFMVRE